MRSRRLPSAVAPPSPNQSSEVRLLLALVDAVAHDRFPEQFKSAILCEEARISGADYERTLLADATPELRAAIAQPNGLDLILGWWEVKGRDDLEFHAGIADLTEQEARAWWLHIERFSYRQIAEYMDGKRRRTRQFGVSVEAVHRYLTRGGEKLRALMVAVA